MKSNEGKVVERQPIKLLKNDNYPTYQLYAVVSSKTPADQAMVIAVLETFSWLRKRFRDLDIPDEINYPEPDKYESVKLDDFKSFRINEGYVVDVVFIKEDGVWAFQLVEPDLGPQPGKEDQERKPAPGRVFATNIAFKINRDSRKLECGFRTMCSEPEKTQAVCEVFRLAVVKSIIRNKLLGLEQIIPITKDPHIINSTDKLERLIAYINNRDRQLPLVMSAQYKRKIDINSLAKDKPAFDVAKLMTYDLEELMAAAGDGEKENKEDPFSVKMQEMAGRKMAYAQFGYLPDKYIDGFNKGLGCNISRGDVCVFYPEKDERKRELYRRTKIDLNEKHFLTDLENKLQEYPKRKIINFGNVIFITEARIEELNRIIRLSNSKEDIIKAMNSRMENVEKKHEDDLADLYGEMHDRDEKIERLNEYIIGLKDDNNKIRSEMEKQIRDLGDEIKNLKSTIKWWKGKKPNQPCKTEDIPQWVEKEFAGKLIFHSRAAGEIKKKSSSEIDMSLLCDAIEYLANEYREERLGKISKDESNRICTEKYGRNFKVTPAGDKSIEMYPIEYKVKYGLGPTGRPKEVFFEQDLKLGIRNRIYFFYDNENDLVVVGSLPEHLSYVDKSKK